MSTPEHLARLNWSTLKEINTSPKMMKYRSTNKRPDSPALKLGSAIHCAVLEPDLFPTKWIAAGDCPAKLKSGAPCGVSGSLFSGGSWYCKKKGHAPEGAGGPPDGIEVIGEADLKLATVCATSILEHDVARRVFQGGHPEHSMEWTNPQYGIACRGRLDYLRPDFVPDLKSSRRENIRDFMMDATRLLYHGQLAWYHDGAIEAGKIPKDAELPKIVMVSTAEPYDVVVFRLSRATYEAGKILYLDLLRKYVNCMNADWWPGMAPDEVELDLPDWAPGMNGPEDNGGEF